MDSTWNDNQPIYRQLRDKVVAMILEGTLAEGDALPSVRSVAAEHTLNPLTVLKGYQQLVDEGLVEKRRGRGMVVTPGAGVTLLRDEPDSLPLGIVWRVKADGLSADQNLAGERSMRIDAVQDLHQGGFAGAVLS